MPPSASIWMSLASDTSAGLELLLWPALLCPLLQWMAALVLQVPSSQDGSGCHHWQRQPCRCSQSRHRCSAHYRGDELATHVSPSWV